MVGQERSELTLGEMWTEAQDRFEKTTSKGLRTSPARRLDDVIKLLETKYAVKTPDEAEQKNRTRRAVHNVLNCVQILGGIAAQGASIVFGPANLCFNAVSFLIDIPGKISKVYGGLANLMEEVYTQLMVFKIYKRIEQSSALDSELLHNTHRMLITIINICALSYKLIDGGKLAHIKTGLKVALFNDDSGVTAELDSLAKLTKAQSTFTGAITLEHVLTTEKDLAQVLVNQCESAEKLSNIREGVDVLVMAETDRKNERLTREQLQKIAKKLSVDVEVIRDQEKVLTRMKNTTVPGTGDWLPSIEDYAAWKDQESDSDPLLVLYGDQTSGKSYLIPTIVDDLDPSFGDAARRSKLMIGYYFFTRRDDRGGRGDQDQTPLEAALKCMCLQIASQHKGFAKEMTTICESKKDAEFKDLSCKDLWNALKLGSPRGEATHVFIFDGLDQLAPSNAEQLIDLLATQRPSTQGYISAKPERLKVRSLVTGSREKPGNLPILIPVPHILVTNYNSSDISKYIERELRNDELFMAEHLQMKTLTTSIRDRLPERASGDFTIVQNKLQRIRQAVEAEESADEIDAIIVETPNEDSENIANQLLSELKASLSAQDIKQLNELLMWTVHGEDAFTAEQLRVALFLRSKKASILPLEKKLKSKYLKILMSEDDKIRVHWSIFDLFRVDNPRVSQMSIEDSTAPKISMTVSITNAPIKKVQQFLWDLSERAAFEKFPFDAKNAEVEAKGSIYVNRIDSYFTMTHQLLELLIDEPDEKTSSLTGYALQHLPSHLDHLHNAPPDRGLHLLERKTILERLLSLLIDTDTVEKHWITGENLRGPWLDTPFGVRAIHDWLEDDEAARLLEPRDKRALRRLVDESEGFGGFWKRLTIVIARNWLMARRWNVEEAFEWIDGFIEMQKLVIHGYFPSPAASPVMKSEDPLEKETALPYNSERVMKAADWVQSTLGIQEHESLWFERLGLTYGRLEEFEAAIAAFKKAKDFPDVHWKVNEGLAMAYAGCQKYYLACREMEIVFTNFRSKNTLEYEEREQFLSDLQSYAGWKIDSKRPRDAFSAYEEALKLNPFDYEICCLLLGVLEKVKDNSRTRDFFTRLNSQVGNKEDWNRLADLLYYVAKDHGSPHDAFIAITKLARQTNLSENILADFDAALKIAERDKSTYGHGCLLLYKGILQARQYEEGKAMKSALACWEQCRALLRASEWDDSIARFYADHLIGGFHCKKAVAAWKKNESDAFHLKKLEAISGLSYGHLTFPLFENVCLLGACYLACGQFDRTKKLFLPHMEYAIDMLSDDDPDNDADGYVYLADVLLHSGDDMNALSAWSLVGPRLDDDTARSQTPEEVSKDVDPRAELDEEEALLERTISASHSETRDSPPMTVQAKRDREGDVNVTCSGRCGKIWTFGDDLWICRFCHDTAFCAECRQLVQDGKLDRYWCDASHTWLHIPPWSDEDSLERRKGRVRVEGKLMNGTRSGGRVVEVKEWLNMVRKDWGLENLEVAGANGAPDSD